MKENKNINKRKPSIAMVVSGFPVISQTFINLQIVELYKIGYNLKIINLGRTGKLSDAPESLKSFLDKLTIIAAPFNDRVGYLKIIAYFVYVLLANTACSPFASLRLFFDKAVRLKFTAFIRMHHAAYLFRNCFDSDIIHFQFVTTAGIFMQLKKYGFPLPQGKTVCSVRGYDISKKDDINDMDRNLLFREVSLFLPVCNYFVDILAKMGCEKAIKVVRSPVNTNTLIRRVAHKATGRKINILSVGRLVEKKGFDDAIKAIYILNQSFSDFKYKIIGEGPLYNLLISKIREYNLCEKVELLGALPSGNTLDIMASYDILLAPSRSAADGDSEGIPNTIKEAMFLGLQVITTRHAGIPELVEHKVNGLLVSEGNPEKIAEALRELIEDTTSWSQRAEKARELILNEYTPEKTTIDLVKAYQSII